MLVFIELLCPIQVAQQRDVSVQSSGRNGRPMLSTPASSWKQASPGPSAQRLDGSGVIIVLAILSVAAGLCSFTPLGAKAEYRRFQGQ